MHEIILQKKNMQKIQKGGGTYVTNANGIWTIEATLVTIGHAGTI